MSYNLKDIEFVVIQSGGIGSRMGKYTSNKPKCLIPYKGKTIIEHLINFFENKKIFIICDHMKDILQSYVREILKRKDIVFIESPEKSTTSGLEIFFNHIEYKTPFIVMWSDLILEDNFDANFKKPISVGLTNNFECRWSVENNKMIKKTSTKNGIIGFFSFSCKSNIENFNSSLSIVGGNLSKLPEENIEYFEIKKIFEIGTENLYEKILSETTKCRFFNEVQKDEINDIVIKKCIDKNYNNLLDNEINWYKILNDKVNFTPKLISENPMTLNLIKGNHIFDMELSYDEKNKIINSIIQNLNKLHSLEETDSNYSDMEEIYLNKTINRVDSIKSIIPNFSNEEIIINNKLCKNPFHPKNINYFISEIKKTFVDKYNIIHGDPTFSNILIDDNFESFLIDPRGIFGYTKIYGDKNYDWAKLFYSVNGNYDSINSKKFKVSFNGDIVFLDIKSNGFEEFSEKIIMSSKMTTSLMHLHHSLIWLSLTGYVKEDIDSVLYSFYYGIYLWNLSLD